MKVVNIVPVDVAGQAKAKMFAAVDWSLQRWNEEGRESTDNIEEGDGENEVDIPGRGTYREEEEEDVGVLGEEHAEEGEHYETHTPRHVPVHELGESSEEGEEVDDSSIGRSPVEDVQALGDETPPHGRSPVGVAQALGEETPRHGRSPVGGGEGPGGESQLLHGVSFSSGVPLTPGRGFRHDDMTRTSSEQEHHQDEELPLVREEAAEEAPQEGMPPIRFSSKPTSRKKVKATRKGRKSLRPPRVGEASGSLDDSAPTSQEGEGEAAEVLVREHDNVGDVPPIDTQSQNVERLPGGVQRPDSRVELNVSSPVEDVAVALTEVLGQGRSTVQPTATIVEEDRGATSPSQEDEVVIRTEVICLDSDDDVPERRVELDVRVKVKDRVPYRVRGTFADYMTDDSEDEDYGKEGYSRVKLNFVDDPHPVFAGRPPQVAGEKESDEKDKVHFAPFVDKYLSEVPENVRLNLAHMYKSYDYHKMFAFLSTPAFCDAVKVKHILHAASLQKMRKRWRAFEAPRERQGRSQYSGSMAAQAQSVVDSTLEIIDVSGVQESPSRDVHVGAAKSSSPHGLPPSSPPHVEQGSNIPVSQV